MNRDRIFGVAASAARRGAVDWRLPTVLRVGVMLAVLVFSAQARAQSPEETFLASEWRCEKAMSRAVARYARDAARCHLACDENAASDPERNCATLESDTETVHCLDRARARFSRRLLRECTAEACPECLRGGDCDSFFSSLLTQTDRAILLRTNQVACLGSGPAASRRDLRCRDRIDARIAAHHRAVQGCFEDCSGRLRQGRSAPGSCSLSPGQGVGADPGLQRCIERARVRFLRGCLSCGDELSCSGLGASPSDTCSTLMAAVESDTSPEQEELFCVDEVRCGDGRVTGAEECDGNAGFCSFGAFCNDECQCEESPAVCGDFRLSGEEECEPFFSSFFCESGDFCSDDCECVPMPEICGDGLLHPNEECDISSGPCVANEFCNAECACEEPPPACGDGFVTGEELCDPGAFPRSCDSSEFCNEDCSACEPLPDICGDGRVSGSEECDPAAFESNCSSIARCSSACLCETLEDSCEDPIVIPPGGVGFDVEIPARGVYDITCRTAAEIGEVVVRWTPLFSGTWTIDTCAPPLGENVAPSTSVSVRDGMCRTSASEVACSWFTCPDSAGAWIELEVESDRTYFIMVNGVSAGSSTRAHLRVLGTYGSANRAFLEAPESLLR